MSSARAIRYRRLALAQEDKATWTCFLSAQINVIGGFSAPVPVGNLVWLVREAESRNSSVS
jgi:hypothetical protein